MLALPLFGLGMGMESSWPSVKVSIKWHANQENASATSLQALISSFWTSHLKMTESCLIRQAAANRLGLHVTFILGIFLIKLFHRLRHTQFSALSTSRGNSEGDMSQPRVNRHIQAT